MKLGDRVSVTGANGKVYRVWAVDGNSQTCLLRAEDDTDRVEIHKAGWIPLSALYPVLA